MDKNINNIRFNDKHVFESIKIKHFSKTNKLLVNKFYKLWIEFAKTNSYYHLKNLISVSFILGTKSALFEQISIILSKYFLKLYKRI